LTPLIVSQHSDRPQSGDVPGRSWLQIQICSNINRARSSTWRQTTASVDAALDRRHTAGVVRRDIILKVYFWLR